MLDFVLSHKKLLAVVLAVDSDCLPLANTKAIQCDMKDCSVDFWLRLKADECAREEFLKNVEVYSSPVAETKRGTARIGTQLQTEGEIRGAEMDRRIDQAEKSERFRDRKAAEKKKKKEADLLKQEKALKQSAKNIEKREKDVKAREEKVIAKVEELKSKEANLQRKARESVGLVMDVDQGSKKRKVGDQIAILKCAEEFETARHEKELENIRHEEQMRAIGDGWKQLIGNTSTDK